MSSLELDYLVLVIVVFVGFAAALAYFSHHYAAHERSVAKSKAPGSGSYSPSSSAGGSHNAASSA